jgi:hypothetical protein
MQYLDDGHIVGEFLVVMIHTGMVAARGRSAY